MLEIEDVRRTVEVKLPMHPWDGRTAETILLVQKDRKQEAPLTWWQIGLALQYGKPARRADASWRQESRDHGSKNHSSHSDGTWQPRKG